MENPAYIIYNNFGLVLYVCSWEYLNLPENCSQEYGDWPRSIDSKWTTYKCFRDSENNYRLTDELHSDPSEILQG